MRLADLFPSDPARKALAVVASRDARTRLHDHPPGLPDVLLCAWANANAAPPEERRLLGDPVELGRVLARIGQILGRPANDDGRLPIAAPDETVTCDDCIAWRCA